MEYLIYVLFGLLYAGAAVAAIYLLFLVGLIWYANIRQVASLFKAPAHPVPLHGRPGQA